MSSEFKRTLIFSVAIGILLGGPATAPQANAACPDKGAKVGDINSTSKIILRPKGPTTTGNVPGGGTYTLVDPDFPGTLTLSNGSIFGDFGFGFSWTGDCEAGTITVCITNADGSSRYQIGSSSGSSPLGGTANPITCTGTTAGLKSAVGVETKIADLYVRAYFRCTSPNRPEVMIFEYKFK